MTSEFRFFVLDGGAVDWEALEPTAALIAPFDWHTQLQMNGRELTDRLDRLRRLPVHLVDNPTIRYDF